MEVVPPQGDDNAVPPQGVDNAVQPQGVDNAVPVEVVPVEVAPPQGGDNSVPPQGNENHQRRAGKRKMSCLEMSQGMLTATKSNLLTRVTELREGRDKLAQMKKEQTRALKVAERRVSRLRQKASQWTNNDLMEVFMLRKQEEEKQGEQLIIIVDGPRDVIATLLFV